MRNIALMCALAALTACGGSPAVDNPNYFNFSFKDGQVSGSYNPAGWNAQTVEQYAARSACAGKMQNYAETPQSNGLVAFTANCTNPAAKGLGSVEVQKT